MAVNRQQKPAKESLIGKVHPVAAEAQFPDYDFFQQDNLLHRQQQLLSSELESHRRDWLTRLEAMFYRTELSLHCQIADEISPVGEPLCFSMTQEYHGLSQPLAWLFIEQASLYQLAEMSFGGEPDPARMTNKRPLSETERRLGTNLLSMLANDLMAQLLLNSDAASVAANPRFAMTAAPSLTEVSWIGFDLECAGQTLSWQMALPLLLSTAPKEPAPVALADELAQALNARLPRLSTRLTISLAEFELSLGQLAQLQAGDILPIHLLQETRARVGEQAILKGRVAEQQGRLVFASHGFID